MITVGERIKQTRIELELSQTELAKRAGYSDKTRISKIENAGNEISMKQVRRIAEAMNVSAAYLMGWEDVGKELSRQTKALTDALKPVSEGLKNLVNLKPANEYYIETPDNNRILLETLSEKYDEQQIKRALEFVKAFLSATPERQKIAIEILQSHQSDS